MLKAKAGMLLAGILFLGVFGVSDLFAQAPGGGGGGGRGGRGDPNVFRQMRMDQLKADLGCTDEEWTALSPKVEKVMKAQQDTRGGGGGRGGRGGRGGGAGGAAPAAPAPTTEVGKAADALSKVLENKDAAPAEIKAALQALRDARAKAKTALEAAQKELKEVLTQRQEAILVEQGMLE
jgi:hypothetical protein